LGTTAFFLGASSTSSASKFKLSGNSQDLMVDPRTDKVAYETGFFPRLMKKSKGKEGMDKSVLEQTTSYKKQHNLHYYAHCHLGLFQMAIHRGIHANDGPLDDGPIFQLNGNLFSIQLL
jgi:hypothetical protein